MTNQSLAPVGPMEWNMMKDQAAMLLETGFLPEAIKTPQQAVAIMLKGRELGIPPMYALSNIAVIKGKPTANAELMLALIYRDHGDDAVVPVQAESGDTQATFLYKRRSWGNHLKFSFTIETARKAGITSNPTWGKYPAAMLRARCISAIARFAFPDSIGGMYTPEEMGAEETFTEDGDHRIMARPEDMVPRIIEEPGVSAGLFNPLDLEENQPGFIDDPWVIGEILPEDRLTSPNDEMLSALRGPRLTPGEEGLRSVRAEPELFSGAGTEEAEEEEVGIAWTWDMFASELWDHLTSLGAAEKLRNTVMDLIYKDLERDGAREDPAVLSQVIAEVRSWNKLQDVTLFATELANKRRTSTQEAHGARR